MVRALVSAIALLLVGSACASDAEEAGTRSASASVLSAPTTVRFDPAAGWHTVTATVPVGEETSPSAWAATVSFDPEDDGADFPDSTVKELEAGEIVISVLGPRRFRGQADFAQLSTEPLVISTEGCVTEAYEGQPEPHIALCHLNRWVGEDQVMNVLVWFGTGGPGRAPSQAQVAAANEELARVVIPGESAVPELERGHRSV
jgi:hypothetical protein